MLKKHTQILHPKYGRGEVISTHKSPEILITFQEPYLKDGETIDFAYVQEGDCREFILVDKKIYLSLMEYYNLENDIILSNNQRTKRLQELIKEIEQQLTIGK